MTNSTGQLIDPQVNGFAGVSFIGDLLTEEEITLVATRLRQGNVRAILPTVVTDDVPAMCARISRLRELIDQDDDLRRLMPAFHIEGPCMSPIEGYRGAHPPQWMRPACREVIDPLLEAAGGADRVAIFTLAPEVDEGLKMTRWLSEQGIIVSAGHTDASLDLLRESEQAGLSMYTHLGNGSAAQMDRHDNIIYRAMSLETITYSIIPDGHHLPFWLVKQWIKWLGPDRCVFTTDCVDAADAPPDFTPHEGITLDTSRGTPVCRLTGTPYLAGAALTPQQGYDNAINHIGLTTEQADAMWCNNPAKLLAKWITD